MTQLVELQTAQPHFADADIKVYAISCDEIDALKDFAESHAITFDLLADEGSQVIREFGILNHLVPEEQVPYHGIPFPGTYVVDETGVVIAKSFHRALSQRESPEGLLDAALGEILLRSGEPTVAHAGDAGIHVSMTYHGGGGVIRGGAIRRLVIRVDLPEGLHIYDNPVPDGMVATSFTLVGPQGLRALPVERPPTHPLELPGIGTLNVWSGTVDFAIPVWATAEIASLVRDDNPDTVTVEVEMAYQACDDTACRLPQTQRLTIDVPIAPFVGPALRTGGMPGAETTTMHTTRWFRSMVERGLAATPDPDAAVAYLADLAAAFDAGPLGTRDTDAPPP